MYVVYILTDVWQEILDDCLNHTEQDIQVAAVRALPAFFTEYYKDSSGVADPKRQGILIYYVVQTLFFTLVYL